jgi:hypothetical protein
MESTDFIDTFVSLKSQSAEADESPLLEAVTRERLVKTQHAGIFCDFSYCKK